MAFCEQLSIRTASIILILSCLISYIANAQMNMEWDDNADSLLTQEWVDSAREQPSDAAEMGQGELIHYMQSHVHAKPIRQSTAGNNWFDKQFDDSDVSSFRPKPSQTSSTLKRKKIYSPEFNRVKQALRPADGLDDISGESTDLSAWDVPSLTEYQPPRPYYERHPAVPAVSYARPSYDAPVNFDYLGNYAQYGLPEYPQYDSFAHYPPYGASNPYGSLNYGTLRRYTPMLYSSGLFAYP